MSEAKSHEILVGDQFGSRAAAYLTSAVHARGEDLDALAALVQARADARVLDLGCGGGHVTFAAAAHAREVVAYDLSADMLATVARAARERGLANVTTRQGVVESLPFADASFDAVFSHALFEHLSDPPRAMSELLRVLKPGAPAVVCTPDWGSFLYSPATAPLLGAVHAYCELQNRNGGDVAIGHKLLEYARQTGFERVRATARYENYQPLKIIGDLVAGKLDQAGFAQHAAAMRDWAAHSDGMFAQAWVSCVAWRPVD